MSDQGPDPTFDRLRRLLEPFADRAHVRTDDPRTFYLEVADRPGADMLGAVMTKKTGVAFHYFPVYADPALLDDISPDLRRRLSGKSCFTFTTPDDPALAELEALVGATAGPFLDARR